jgi:hypothetical protein
VCGDAGVISGWRGTYWDLSGRQAQPTADPEGARRVDVRLSQEDYELLRDRVGLYERESERIVAAARPAGTERVLMSGRLDDWDFLMGEVAFEANHTDDRRLQRRLDQLVVLLDSGMP